MILKEIGLAEPTSTSSIVEQAAQSLFSRETIDREDCVHFAHILAALDVEAPSHTQYVMRDNSQRNMSDGVMLDDGTLDGLIPTAWADDNLLHPDYSAVSGACSASQWRTWSGSDRSGLRAFAVFTEIQRHLGQASGGGFSSHPRSDAPG